MRDTALRRREALRATAGPGAAAAAAARLARSPLAPRIAARKTFSGYAPIGAEFDPGPLMAYCHAQGLTGALPVVTPSTGPVGARDLVFQRWQPGLPVAPGGFGVPIPDPPTETVLPELLLVPLLAVDRQGWRLGYGAGFYDRALRGLRRRGVPVVAVGVGFLGQIVDAVPHHDGDERLDWIVTEAAIIECGTGVSAGGG